MAIKRITTNLIEDSEVSTADIANNAITAAKITDGNITTAKLADLSVTAGKLAGTLDLTGKTITVATATTGDSDTSPASTAFVQQEIAALVDSSPSSLNTLNELAAALGDDASFSTTVTNSIATKLPLAGGTVTGTTTFTGGDGVVLQTSSDTFLQLKTTGSGSNYIEFKDSGGATGNIRYNHSTNLLSVKTNGTDNRLVIDSSGNVGIGNSSPSSLYWPNGSTGGLFLQAGGLLSAYNAGTNLSQNWYYNSGEKFIGNGGASRYVQSGQEHIWSHSTAVNSSGAGAGLTWSESMRIDSSGNVGIGTDSITNNTFGKTTYFGNSTSSITGDSSSARFWLGNNWYYNSGDKFIGTGYANLYTQQSGNHEFLTSTASGTAGAAATFTSVLKILPSGNVGIGTSSPNANAKLHVQGTGDSQILIYETGTSPYTSTLKLASQSTTAYGANVQYTSGAEQLTIENFGRALSAGSTSGGIRFRTKVGNGSLAEVMKINGHEGAVTTPHQPFFMTNRSAGNQTFANAAWVDVSWTGEPYDTGGNYTLSSGVFTAPVAGVYLFTGLIGFDTITTTNYLLARIACSSAGDFYITHEQKRDGGGDYGYDAAISQMVYLAASETVKMQVFAGSGGNHTLGSRSNWQGRLLG